MRSRASAQKVVPVLNLLLPRSCRQTETDEAVAALKEKHEREKNLLSEENRKLTAENDKVSRAAAPRIRPDCSSAHTGSEVT